MNLQAPWALLWFVPVGGAIIALYFLRMRRRRMVVPALFLWPERLDEVRANALFQRLRFSWLLLLQILAALLATVVLARPQFLQQGLSGTVTVVVVDASASMGARDVAPDRFAEARRIVSGVVEGAQPGDRTALIEAGPAPRVVFPLSNDPQAQRRGLDGLRRYDAEADLAAALRLAASLVGSTSGGTILLVSDGAFEPVKDFSPGKARVVYRQVGDSGENASVQALGSAETPSGRQLYCGVKNHGTQPARVVLDLLADGKAVDSAEATVAPGEVWGRTVAVPRRAMVFEARLAEGGGALAADDVAYHVQDPGATVRALIVGPGDFFTERALVLDPRVTLDRAASLPESERPGSPGAPGYDIVVFSGVPEQETKARGVLTLGQAGPSSPVQATGRWQRPGAFVTTDDPLLQGVSFDGVFVESGEKVRPRGSGRVLADCDQGPVVVASGGPTRRVYLAFRPLDSDFPLNVSFPIFVANAIDFLAPKQAGGSFVLQPARPALIPWPTDGDVGVSGPGGFAATWKSTGGRLAVKNLDLAGVYRLGQGSGAKTLYAGLRSETESSIAPRTTVELGDESVVRQSAPFRFVDFWRPILLVLLVVLGIEWWLYGRLS